MTWWRAKARRLALAEKLRQEAWEKHVAGAFEVIDDGPTDDTARVAAQLRAIRAGAMRHPSMRPAPSPHATYIDAIDFGLWEMSMPPIDVSEGQ